MNDEFILGVYKYKCRICKDQLPELPEQLKITNISPCGVLLELVMGKMEIWNGTGVLLYNKEMNYAKLPAEEQNTSTYEQFNEILNTNVLDDECRRLLYLYFAGKKRIFKEN